MNASAKVTGIHESRPRLSPYGGPQGRRPADSVASVSSVPPCETVTVRESSTFT